jgi:isoquinoline 1-oxidoreductase beta subunit
VDVQECSSDARDAGGVSRRRFLGWVIAAPTLVTAADLTLLGRTPAHAGGIPSTGQVAEYYDLIDMLRDSQLPTANLIQVVVNTDGTVGFDLHRTEVGQGISTAIAMIIADEMGVRLDDVRITLADARPELLMNQITGGSHTIFSLFTPVRVAAALARERLLQAAAMLAGGEAARFELVDSIVRGPNGETFGIGELATRAAAEVTEQLDVALDTPTERTLVGTPQNRIDGPEIVMGGKQFALDLTAADLGEAADAQPTMIARPPTFGGSVAGFHNAAAILAMPGVTDVAVVDTGVAVRAATFGQCIDAIQAMQVSWTDGPAKGLSDADVEAELAAAELPVVIPTTAELDSMLDAAGIDLGDIGGLLGRLLPLGGITPKTLKYTTTYAFQTNTPLEPNCAVADVRPDRAEIWTPAKNPIVTSQRLAELLGLPLGSVKLHVTPGGGSFGRDLFWDGAHDAALCSQAFGKPVKLMWHRTDEFRHGRVHPACRSTIGAVYSQKTGVLWFQQHHTSVQTDFTHGFGEIVTAMGAALPPDVRSLIELQGLDIPGAGDIGYSQTIFHFTQWLPYNFGLVQQLLNEANTRFRTAAMRNVYSPNVVTSRELMIERIAADLGRDSYALRRDTLKDGRSKAVMAKVAEVGRWGKTMPPGTAQGIGFHAEYKSRCAVLVELDCRPSTVDRDVPGGYTGARVTKATIAVDVGVPINPRGLEAQMIGALHDGIANALTYGLHLVDGAFVEGSWDQAYYSRQWNSVPDVEVIVMEPTTEHPGGAGELGVAASMSAVACAYARATRTWPTHFPINHREALPFTPYPTSPSVPQSPTTGLAGLPGR